MGKTTVIDKKKKAGLTETTDQFTRRTTDLVNKGKQVTKPVTKPTTAPTTQQVAKSTEKGAKTAQELNKKYNLKGDTYQKQAN